MEEKDQLIAEIDSAREVLRAALADFEPNQNIYSPWTVKELMAHLVGWYDAVIASLHAHATGDSPATPAVRGIDHYNAQSVAERDSLTYEHIQREWNFSLEQIKQAVQEMPEEKFNQQMIFPWGSRGTVSQLVLIFTDHEREHAEEIRNLKNRN